MYINSSANKMIKIWKYKAPTRGYAGFHLMAGPSFLQKLKSLEVTKRYEQPLSKVLDLDLSVPNNGSEIKNYRFVSLFRGETSSIIVDNQTVVFKIDDSFYGKLLKGIETIQEDIGDYCIESDSGESLWFWGPWNEN